MKIDRYFAIVLGMVLCLEGCAAPMESNLLSESGAGITDEVSPPALESTKENIGTVSLKTVEETENGTEAPFTAETVGSGVTQDVPETTETFPAINIENYCFDRNVCRFVADKDGNILEPENDNEPPLKYVYDMADSQYIGTGELLGTRADAKLYLMSDGNILSVFPCDIEPYSDAEELLSKYSRDMIFEACCFLRADS